jgi:predicted XRE-type DNA-binding protein
MAAKKGKAHLGSGNVFADIGVGDPEEMLVKAELSARIVDIVRARGLTQVAAAKLLGVDQPRVSALFHGQIRQFSVERLMRFLTALHRDVRIVVEAKPRRRRGRVSVEAA